MIYSGARAQRSTMGKKILLSLCIRENLVVTRPYIHPPARPPAPQVYQCKITGMAAQMELGVFRAEWGSHARAGHLERKNNNNLESFFI